MRAIELSHSHQNILQYGGGRKEGSMTTITLPNDLAELLAQQARPRQQSVEALAIEYRDSPER
jgi:hypothetical protein